MLLWFCLALGGNKVRLSGHSKKRGFLNNRVPEKRLRHHMQMQWSPSGHTDIFLIFSILFNTCEITAIHHPSSLGFFYRIQLNSRKIVDRHSGGTMIQSVITWNFIIFQKNLTVLSLRCVLVLIENFGSLHIESERENIRTPDCTKAQSSAFCNLSILVVITQHVCKIRRQGESKIRMHLPNSSKETT